jgi:hypothetical protein
MPRVNAPVPVKPRHVALAPNSDPRIVKIEELDVVVMTSLYVCSGCTSVNPISKHHHDSYKISEVRQLSAQCAFLKFTMWYKMNERLMIH